MALEAKTKEKDGRVRHVEVEVTQIDEKVSFYNSYGVHASQRYKLFTGSVAVVATDEKGDTRSGFKSFTSFLSLEELSKKAGEAIEAAVKSAVDFFGATACESGEMPVLFSAASFRSLLTFYLTHFSAKNVQEKLSLFRGRLGKKIASPLLTIDHRPHLQLSGAAAYDAEGVPTANFPILRKGVLLNYAHCLETARKAKTVSNGCAIGGNQASFQVVSVHPGKTSLSDMLKSMKDGLYITKLNGLNSGIDAQSLHFSLPCEGYLVRDGAIDKSVSMIVVAGNVAEVMANVIALSSERETFGSIVTPAALVAKLSISGSDKK